jgi:hydrophobic/amphiphilic exporter-1 (mainly G- bacteria), HAE1 family
MRLLGICFRRAVVAIASMLALAGHRPAFAAEAPTITITVEWPGASADSMAIEVAAPLERRFATIAGVASITSINTAGRSEITVEFDGDRDEDAAAVEVRSAVSEVGLPQDLPSSPVVAREGCR